MTQAEIKERLHRLRYEGKWSIRGLAKEFGMSPPNLTRAFHGDMSIETQARLSSALKVVLNAPPQKERKKKTHGRLKRSLIRFYNLVKWCSILANEPGISKRYHVRWQQKMNQERASYVCILLDHFAKRYLLEIYGEEIKKKRITLADCYQFESWVLSIEEKSDYRKELLKKLQIRKGK